MVSYNLGNDNMCGPLDTLLSVTQGRVCFVHHCIPGAHSGPWHLVGAWDLFVN